MRFKSDRMCSDQARAPLNRIRFWSDLSDLFRDEVRLQMLARTTSHHFNNDGKICEGTYHPQIMSKRISLEAKYIH
jgi:hypothetical protein